jgi:hypothetical protein
MEYSTVDTKAVFLNEDCRRVFGRSQYTTLTKKRDIRSTIQEHAISVADFSEDKLVIILHYLIKKGVFLAATSIEFQFPDLDWSSLPSKSSNQQVHITRPNIWLQRFDYLPILHLLLVFY